MKSNKGISLASIILNILIILLIVFLLYEIFYIDIFDIMNTEASVINLNETSSEIRISSSANQESESTENVELIISNNIYNTSSEDSSIYKYYYNQLDEYAKIIYDAFEDNKENMQTGTYAIDFDTTFNDLLNSSNGEETLNIAFQSAWNAYTYDNMDIFYIDVEKLTLTTRTTSFGIITSHEVEISNGSNTSYLKESFSSQSIISERLNVLETIVEKIVIQLEGYSDYEKIKEVHNWLVENIEYDVNLEANEPYSIIGALIEGKAVCEGYARSFKYIMDGLGIPCVLVSGTGTNSNGETESHAWNYVQLEGNWYAVDVTWDDPVVIGNGYVSTETRYKHFLRGSDTFFETHQEDGYLSPNSIEFEFPVLSVTDY